MNYQSDRNTKQPRCMVCGRFVETMKATSHYTPDSPFTVETCEWECERCQMREDSAPSNAEPPWREGAVRLVMTNKPLGGKAYGSIGHLPNSRVGPKDHHVHEGQARICTVKARDKHDRVIVQEKLDGSCTAVAMVNGEIVALGRAGWPASTSPYEMHQLFAEWVKGQEERFRAVLREGERLVGEWLAQAHGTRYRLPHEPWVCFDLMLGNRRATVEQLRQAAYRGEFIVPMVIHDDRGAYAALDTQTAMSLLGKGFHGAVDPVEGAVWRVERQGKVDFLAKWVRADKEDGSYLPELTGGEPVWNWRPSGPGAAPPNPGDVGIAGRMVV